MDITATHIDITCSEAKSMLESSCRICGAPVYENENMCMNCKIEKYIRDCTAEIEM